MRFYGLEEARDLLPQVIPVLERLQSAFLRLNRGHAGPDLGSASKTNGHGLSPQHPFADEERRELTETIQECTDLLEAWGIQLKDPARGLIDFYHDRDGETVFLCYLLGEADIGYWHTLEGGFAGRQPL